MSDIEDTKLGRPTKYRDDFPEIAANLCASGATDQEVADYLGVVVSTLYQWKAIYPDFSKALKVGKELADDRVIASLYHRAVGYTYPAVKIFQNGGEPVIVPYREHVPPEVGAGKLWLTNRKPDEWRDKQNLEHTGKDGKDLNPTLADFYATVTRIPVDDDRDD